MTTDFSGPASGIVLIEGPDHGVQPKPLHNPRGIFYRPRRLYAAPGRQWFASGPLWILYEAIESIEVRPGPKAKMLLTTPRNAHKIGVVVVVTRHQRRAEFAGRVVGGLAEFFTDLGARAQT